MKIASFHKEVDLHSFRTLNNCSVRELVALSPKSQMALLGWASLHLYTYANGDGREDMKNVELLSDLVLIPSWKKEGEYMAFFERKYLAKI